MSEYAAKPLQFQRLALARRLDGTWVAAPAEQLRTLRLPPELALPDLDRSRGVAGWRDLPQGRYLALDGRRRVELVLGEDPEQGPRLEQADGRVLLWRREEGRLLLRLAGHRPVRLVLAGAAGCRPSPGVASWRRGDRLVLRFPGKDTGRVELACP